MFFYSKDRDKLISTSVPHLSFSAAPVRIIFWSESVSVLGLLSCSQRRPARVENNSPFPVRMADAGSRKRLFSAWRSKPVNGRSLTSSNGTLGSLRTDMSYRLRPRTRPSQRGPWKRKRRGSSWLKCGNRTLCLSRVSTSRRALQLPGAGANTEESKAEEGGQG